MSSWKQSEKLAFSPLPIVSFTPKVKQREKKGENISHYQNSIAYQNEQNNEMLVFLLTNIPSSPIVVDVENRKETHVASAFPSIASVSLSPRSTCVYLWNF